MREAVMTATIYQKWTRKWIAYDSILSRPLMFTMVAVVLKKLIRQIAECTMKLNLKDTYLKRDTFK